MNMLESKGKEPETNNSAVDYFVNAATPFICIMLISHKLNQLQQTVFWRPPTAPSFHPKNTKFHYGHAHNTDPHWPTCSASNYIYECVSRERNAFYECESQGSTLT